MLVLIDNHGSFTHGLAHMLAEAGAAVTVVDRDAASLADLDAMRPERIVISPGPGRPAEARLSLALVTHFAGRVPVLGISLGLQCIAEAFGGSVVPAPERVHGAVSLVFHNGEGVLRGLPSPFEAARYHSLVVSRDSLPGVLAVTAQTSQGHIMALRHREYPIEGVQFNPESLLTRVGRQILANFLAG